MEKELFSPMEIDALGEMMNISLGSSATAVSNLLDHRVDITTPKVTVVPTEDFTIGNLEPAMGVEIKYVEGLEGSNIMLLRRRDIKVIVDILMGSETPDEEFELNDLTISAVCEVMNQISPPPSPLSWRTSRRSRTTTCPRGRTPWWWCGLP